MSDSGVQYVVGKIPTRATTSVQTSLRPEVRARSYDLPKSWESRTGTLGWISGLQLGSPGKKSHLDVGAAERRRIYYKGVWWWHAPKFGPWWVLWFEVPVACPNTKGCPGKWTNHLGGLFWCRFKLDQLIPLPSLIPRLPTRPLYPFLELEAGSAFRVPTFRNYILVNPQVGSPRDLGVRHDWHMKKSLQIYQVQSHRFFLPSHNSMSQP